MAENATTAVRVERLVGRRWLCCRRMRRSSFCEDCGAKRPDVVVSSEAEELADEFKAEYDKCCRTADTHDSEAESIRVEHKLDELLNEKRYDERTWGDIAYQREQSAKGFRKRANMFARWHRILRELIEKRA